MGYNAVAGNTGLRLAADSSPIRLAVVGSQIHEISRNSVRIRVYISSRSFKVIDLGVNRKRICDFLLVINSIYIV